MCIGNGGYSIIVSVRCIYRWTRILAFAALKPFCFVTYIPVPLDSSSYSSIKYWSSEFESKNYTFIWYFIYCLSVARPCVFLLKTDITKNLFMFVLIFHSYSIQYLSYWFYFLTSFRLLRVRVLFQLYSFDINYIIFM